MFSSRNARLRAVIIAATMLAALVGSLDARQPAPAESSKSKSTAKATTAAPKDTPTEVLVFLGAEHPVFVRLFAYIDGSEVRAMRAQRIAKTLAELDDNRDGAIDQTERDAHPRALRSIGVPEKWAALLPLIDRQPQDGLIKSEEILQLIVDRFGPAVTLAGKVRRGNQAVELFDLVDADHDQRLTEAEIDGLAARLNKLDADGDDSFSIVEVEPFRNPFGAATSSSMTSTDDLPWAVSKSCAERLMSRFDVAPKDKSLSAVELGQPEASIAAADGDKSGGLSLDELHTWLPTVTPQYALTTKAFKKKAGRTESSWEDLTSIDDATGKPLRETWKNLDVKLAGMPFQIQMLTVLRGSDSLSVNFYRSQLLRLDADKNKYLDKNEFNGLPALDASFEMLDADDNGQLYEVELVDYLSLESVSEQSRVILSFDRSEKSLFSILDRNNDRRLTPREVKSTFDRWQSFDHDGDHVLNRSELSGIMRMTVELPKPKLLQQGAVQPSAMNGNPVIKMQNDGPLWFQGMDRNKDGDVSRREFLGSDAQFRKWDRDADGLIGNNEAKADAM